MISSVPPTVTPEISLVSPTYQRVDSVLLLVRALDRQTLPTTASKILVVIDGSTDGSFGVHRGASGGFDQAFWIYGNNAVEIGSWLRTAGGKLAFLPHAVAFGEFRSPSLSSP